MVSVYRYCNTEIASKYIVAIDTGLATSGLSILNKVTGENKLVTLFSSYQQSSNFVDLIVPVNNQCQNYLETIYKYVPEKEKEYISLVVEHPVYNPEFTFSIGLNMLASAFVNYVLSRGIKRLNLVPPVITQYFLQKKNITLTEIKTWLKYFMPLYNPKELTAHSIDALLLSLFTNYEYYEENKLINTGVKKPVYDVKELNFGNKETDRYG